MKAMCPLALFNPSQATGLLASRIAQALRMNGYGCDLNVYTNYKRIFSHNYEYKNYDRVWVLGDKEAERGKILYCTKYGVREEWDIEGFIEPNEVYECSECGIKQ